METESTFDVGPVSELFMELCMVCLRPPRHFSSPYLTYHWIYPRT